MNKYIQELKILLQRANCTDSDTDLLIEANEKLMCIFSEASYDDDKTKIEFIRSFINADEVKKRKLLSYCVAFNDPTISTEITMQGEQICQHAYLKYDEFYLLQQFVKRHQNDISFGETVYKIMDKHGMTAPQVYKNALIRRQDFARVTDLRCKNVTRKMTWQIIIGLHCSLEEADDVLFSAGYIRRNTRMDLTMQYFIENKNYDIEAIDAVLSELGLKTFTCE